MKVAIWGSYNYGNYGDDIMAIQFAKTLQNQGCEPWVYRLDKAVAHRFQIKTTHSLEELFSQTKFCLIGGGAMLESGAAENDQDFEALHLSSTQHQCPVFPVSVGGDGQGILTQLSPEKLKFWSSDMCKSPTVRLTSDIAFLQLLGKKANYYPDVLWTVQKFWNIEPKVPDPSKLHIGINMPKSLAAKLFARQLIGIAAIRQDIVFHFICTYLPTSPINLELMPDVRSPCIQHHVYSDPKETLEFLSTLDLLVSHKLHLGLTALALNVPFLSLGGKGKTTSFLKELGAEFAILSSRKKNTDLVALLVSRKRLGNFRDQFNWPLIDKIKSISVGHVDYVKALAMALKADELESGLEIKQIAL